MRLLLITLISVFFLTGFLCYAEAVTKPVWPPAPDEPRIEFVDVIEVKELSAGGGFFSKLKDMIVGSSDDDNLALPFDLAIYNNTIYMTCQGAPHLVEISIDKQEFTLHNHKEFPLNFPLCVDVDNNGTAYMTDSDNGAVYVLKDDKLELLIKDNLARPTGICVNQAENKIFVIDTGEHTLKVFDLNGILQKVIPDGDSEISFNFPTFISKTQSGNIFVNDGLNYQVKQLTADGEMVSFFGQEGDGPGTFSRPKGIALDSEKNIYVIDNLFDNLQVFDSTGQLLLVLGSSGQGLGQFWSPTGIEIYNDTIYIADTYNHRIQILHFLGGPK